VKSTRPLTNEELDKLNCENELCEYRFVCIHNDHEGCNPKWMVPTLVAGDSFYQCEDFREEEFEDLEFEEGNPEW
jgi:hypothetical protein